MILQPSSRLAGPMVARRGRERSETLVVPLPELGPGIGVALGAEVLERVGGGDAADLGADAVIEIGRAHV